jgi:predicted ester cyclase
MKKVLTMASFALICYCTSCTSKPEGSLSATAQKNLDAMHGVTQCLETKDFSKLGDYIATDAVDHAGDNGEVKGLDSIKMALAKEVAGVDGMKTEYIKELADDDYVMSWEHFTGIIKAPMMGLKAGDKFDLTEIEVAKFKDGKATDHWSMLEPAQLMKLMGNAAQQMMMPAMPADSLKKKK